MTNDNNTDLYVVAIAIKIPLISRKSYIFLNTQKVKSFGILALLVLNKREIWFYIRLFTLYSDRS